MPYSSGSNPRPRISYAGASPTGAASEAEYLEIGLAETVDPQRLAEGHRRAARARLRGPAAPLPRPLPAGRESTGGCRARPASLAAGLEGSRWQIDVPLPVDAVAPA